MVCLKLLYSADNCWCPWSRGLRSFISGKRQNIWQGFFFAEAHHDRDNPSIKTTTIRELDVDVNYSISHYPPYLDRDILNPSKKMLLVVRHWLKKISIYFVQTWLPSKAWRRWTHQSRPFVLRADDDEVDKITKSAGGCTKVVHSCQEREYSASDKRQTMPIVIIITRFTLLPNLICEEMERE